MYRRGIINAANSLKKNYEQMLHVLPTGPEVERNLFMRCSYANTVGKDHRGLQTNISA